MSSEPTVRILNWGTYQTSTAILGHGFVFENPQSEILGVTRPKVTSLWGLTTTVTVDDSFQVSGVRLDPRQLGAVSIERDVYRPDETAFSVVYLPAWAGKAVDIQLLVNNQIWQNDTVVMNARGVALWTNPHLSRGANTLRVADAQHVSADFTVADFQQSKLVASLIGPAGQPNFTIDTDTETLHAGIEVRINKRPYADKTIRVRLMAAGRTVKEDKFKTDSNGQCQVALDISGSTENLSLNIHGLGRDGTLTATIRLSGAAKEERDLTTICPLGDKIRSVSLSPSGRNELPIRGLFMSDGLSTVTPLSALNVLHNGEAYFRVNVQLLGAQVVVYDPTFDTYTTLTQAELLNPGDEITVPVSGPWSTILVGAWYQEGGQLKPWQGWSMAIAESEITLSLDHPEQVSPDGTLPLDITLSHAASVVAFVHPAQFTQRDLSEALANQLKLGMAALGKNLKIGTQSRRLVEQTISSNRGDSGVLGGFGDEYATRGGPATFGGGLTLGGGNYRGSRSPFETTRGGGFYDEGGLESMMIPKGLGFGDSAVQTTVEIEVAREAGPLTVYAQLLELEAGTTTVSIEMPSDIARYTISVVAVGDNMDWIGTESQVQVAKATYVDMQEVRQLFPGTSAAMKIYVETRSGHGRLQVSQSGKPLQVRVGGSAINANTVFTTPAEAYVVVSGPGTVVCTVVDDGSGETDRVIQDILDPTEVVQHFLRTHLVMPGETVTAAELRADYLRVLPALAELQEKVLLYVGSFEHACCEQTSAKIIAALFNLAQGIEEAHKDLAIGMPRMDSMLLSGGQIAFYPGREPNHHYSGIAALNLQLMAMFRGRPGLGEYQALIEKFVAHGKKAAPLYEQQLDVNATPQDLVQAYHMTVLGRSAQDMMAIIPTRLRETAEGGYELTVQPRYGGGTIQARTEAAYGAAIAAIARNSQLALKLAKWVMSFMKEGQGYSTFDSLAILLMNEELRKAGLLGSEGLVYADGNLLRMADAKSFGNAEVVQASGTPVLVQYPETRVTTWGDAKVRIPMQFGLTDMAGTPINSLPANSDAMVVVVLPEGYKAGYQALILFSHNLGPVRDGVQVLMMNVDFAGSDRIEIQVRAKSATVGQHDLIGVKVTSMYDDEAGGNALAEFVVL